jgi:hypothetical protein
MTTIADGQAKRAGRVHDLTIETATGKRAVPDWTHAQLVAAQVAAVNGKQLVGRPLLSRGIKLKPAVLEQVLEATKGRTWFRLPADSALRGDQGSGLPSRATHI